MSHHFDTKLAKQDPRLNICDFYLFEGQRDNTVMVMTVNADVGFSSPDTFHTEGTYAFRFDLDGDAHEEVVFKFRFGEPGHRHEQEHRHSQSFRVMRAVGGDMSGDAGELIAEGTTDEIVHAVGVSAFVGMVPELWAADAFAFQTTLANLFLEDRFDPDVFLHKVNLFKNRNVMAIILEVPNAMIAEGEVNGWATISLYGHASEVQICRAGYPLFTHLFLSNPTTHGLSERYHSVTPSHDIALFAEAIAAVTERLSRRSGATSDPGKYGREVAASLCPSTLPYEIGTSASFRLPGANGRALIDDAYDVMWTRVANRPISDGVSPDTNRIIRDFPYYGRPYSEHEQAGLSAIRDHIGYGLRGHT